MAIESGSLIFLRIDDASTLKTLVGEISSELSLTADMIETTTKDSVDASGNPVKTYIAGESGFTFSVEGLHDPSGDWSVSQIVTALKAGTSHTFQFGGTELGDKYFSGTGLFSGVTFSPSKNEAPSVSSEIQGTGELVEGTVGS